MENTWIIFDGLTVSSRNGLIFLGMKTINYKDRDSMAMGIAQTRWMVCNGKSQSNRDDDWGYPYWKPPVNEEIWSDPILKWQFGQIVNPESFPIRFFGGYDLTQHTIPLGNGLVHLFVVNFRDSSLGLPHGCFIQYMGNPLLWREREVNKNCC